MTKTTTEYYDTMVDIYKNPATDETTRQLCAVAFGTFARNQMFASPIAIKAVRDHLGKDRSDMAGLVAAAQQAMVEIIDAE